MRRGKRLIGLLRAFGAVGALVVAALATAARTCASAC
jgi:hypothetical protein